MKLQTLTQDTVPFGVWVDATGSQAEPGNGSEEIVFHLRRLTGRDVRELSSMTVKTDKRGTMVPQMGEMVREKVVRSVVRVENLYTVNDEPIEKLGAAEFDALPGWICDALLAKVNEINGFDAED